MAKTTKNHFFYTKKSKKSIFAYFLLLETFLKFSVKQLLIDLILWR